MNIEGLSYIFSKFITMKVLLLIPSEMINFVWAAETLQMFFCLDYYTSFYSLTLIM